MNLLNLILNVNDALPSSAPATVTTFNTSLPAGQMLVNFTANTTDGNQVNFTISTLIPYDHYAIKRDSMHIQTIQANSAGVIEFNNSAWPEHTFTVHPVGNLYGFVKDNSGAPMVGANVTAGEYTATTNGTGGYLFANIAVGSYNVTASVPGYVSTSQSAVIAANQTAILNLTLTTLGNISGYITYISNGAGISGAEVKLYYANATEYRSTASASNGSYNFTDIINSTSFYIRASKNNHIAANSSSFTVPVGGSAAVNVMIYSPNTAPPASIESLNSTYAETYINWTWIDPEDLDFSKVMIYLNGIFKTNSTKGEKFYNATGLLPDTAYTISTHTVDASGNVNQTWINHTARTASTSIPDATPTTITILSPQSIQYPTNVIPLTYYANEPVTECYVSVDGTANQTLPACANMSVMSREYGPTSNMAAWWHFNENSGSAVQDSSGNNTGNRNGATWATGKFGSALQFDGSGYIEVPDSNILDGGNQITIEAWVRPIIGTRGSIVAKYTYNYTIPVNGRVYKLDIANDGKVKFALSSNGTGSGTVWLTSNNTVINNTWNHIVAISNGTTMKLYMNGDMDTNTISAPPVIHSSPYDLQIGAWKYDPDGSTVRYFQGIIDEVRILKKALTDEEIKADYALGAGSHNVTVYAKDISGISILTTQYFIAIESYDINGDGAVNVLDLNSIVSHLGESYSGPPYQIYDVNRDGNVSPADIVLVGEHFDR